MNEIAVLKMTTGPTNEIRTVFDAKLTIMRENQGDTVSTNAVDCIYVSEDVINSNVFRGYGKIICSAQGYMVIRNGCTGMDCTWPVSKHQ